MVADRAVCNGGLGRLPNITGNFTGGVPWDEYTANGAFYNNGTASKGPTGSGSNNSRIISFAASNSNTIYQDSDRVVPAWLNLNFIIKYT